MEGHVLTDDLEAARARIAELASERADLLDQLAALRATNTAQLAELTDLREERARPFDERLDLRARPDNTTRVPQPSTGRPELWEHNRRFPPVSGGTAADVVCPNCRAAGQEVQMVRELGAGNAIAQERGFELEQVTCPRCLATGWLRLR